MVKIQFNSPEQFLEELGKEAQRVSRKIVRVTAIYSTDARASTIRHISILATALVSYSREDQADGPICLLQLDYYVGQELADADISKETLSLIEDGCKKFELEVRSGYYKGDR